MEPLGRFTHWIAFFSLAAPGLSAAASNPTTAIAHLPNVLVNAAKVDASGNIYLAGQTTGSAPGPAYIAKVSPSGSTIYTVTLGGTGTTTATALDIDSTGDAYIAGNTTATDFPVTAGAVSSAGATGFAVKLDAKGNIVYSALIGGNAQTVPHSVVVNSKGELVVTGQATTGGPPNTVLSLFLLKLSADGTQVTSGPSGIGGLATVDAQDNVYVAGVPFGSSSDPAATGGAFQQQPMNYFCGCPFFGYECGGDQFVAGLTPDLSQVRFLTYVTAKYGASPSYIAINSQGNILLAGTTAAPGYPTTPDTYEPNYTALTKTILTCGPPISMEQTSPSGYVTLVKGDGSGLIFSTFFSGSNTDTITFAALTNAGIYLGGEAGSTDLPGFDGAVPSACAPLGYVSRISLDGTTVASSHTPPGTPLAFDPTTGTVLLVYGNDLLRFDPAQDTPIACMLDAADLSPVSTVAPGELLSMFGRFLYLQNDTFGTGITPVKGQFPVASQGLGIMANQTAAPLLYLSPQQINFQVPYEVAGSSQANVTVTYSDVNGNSFSDARTAQVAASNPVAFLSAPSLDNQSFPLVLNADGTANSSTNPAQGGSVVTMFLDGLGVTSPAPVTGMVNASPAAPVSVALMVTPPCTGPGTACSLAPTLVSVSAAPGSISGLTQVQLLAPVNPFPPSIRQSIFSIQVGSTGVRDTNLSFWFQ